jgi:hypothetical protein
MMSDKLGFVRHVLRLIGGFVRAVFVLNTAVKLTTQPLSGGRFAPIRTTRASDY